MTKKILGIAVAVVVIILGAVGYSLFHAGGSLAAPANLNSINLVPSTSTGGDSYAIALNGATILTASGTFSLSGAGSCGTVGWTPASISSSTPSSTSVTLNGATLGNFCIASLTSATSSFIQTPCSISAANTASVLVTVPGGVALTVGTGTIKACLLQ